MTKKHSYEKDLRVLARSIMQFVKDIRIDPLQRDRLAAKAIPGMLVVEETTLLYGDVKDFNAVGFMGIIDGDTVKMLNLSGRVVKTIDGVFLSCPVQLSFEWMRRVWDEHGNERFG